MFILKMIALALSIAASTTVAFSREIKSALPTAPILALGQYDDTNRAEITMNGAEEKKLPAVMTLREAILLSLTHNPDVLNSEIERINAKYAFNQAQYNYRWQFGVSGNFGVFRQKVDNENLPTTYHSVATPTAKRLFRTGTTVNLALDDERDSFHFHPRAKLSISQPLLRGLKPEVVLKPYYDALDQETVSRIDLKNQIAAHIVQVIKAYRELVLVNNNVEIARQSLKDMQETYRKNAKQIELGTLPRTINVGVAAQVAGLKLRVVESINQVSFARQQLIQAIGLEGFPDITVPSDVSMIDLNVPSLGRTIDEALLNNLDYQKALLSYKQHHRDEVKAEDDMKWQLDLTGAVSVGGGGAEEGQNAGFDGLTNGRNHTEQISLDLNIPIDDLPRKAAVVRAKTQLEKDENSLRKAQSTLINDIRNSLVNLKSLAQQVILAKESLDLERENYHLQVKKQELGQGTALEVTNSQNALIQARIRVITTKISYLNATTDLHFKLGSLLEQWKINVRY